MKLILYGFLNFYSKLVIDTDNDFSYSFFEDKIKYNKSGLFFQENELFMFFCFKGDIYLFYNGQFLNVRNSKIKLKIVNEEGKNTIFFIKDNQIDYKYTYDKPEPLMGPDYTEDELDVDFFLILTHHLANEESIQNFKLWYCH